MRFRNGSEGVIFMRCSNLIAILVCEAPYVFELCSNNQRFDWHTFNRFIFKWIFISYFHRLMLSSFHFFLRNKSNLCVRARMYLPERIKCLAALCFNDKAPTYDFRCCCVDWIKIDFCARVF